MPFIYFPHTRAKLSQDGLSQTCPSLMISRSGRLIKGFKFAYMFMNHLQGVRGLEMTVACNHAPTVRQFSKGIPIHSVTEKKLIKIGLRHAWVITHRSAKLRVICSNWQLTDSTMQCLCHLLETNQSITHARTPSMTKSDKLSCKPAQDIRSSI